MRRARMMRINLILDREEDPLVYDILGATPKGVRRTTRLKLLLHDGALAQAGLLSGTRVGERLGDRKQPGCGPADGHRVSRESATAGAAEIFAEMIVE